jgi:hypothetical protein
LAVYEPLVYGSKGIECEEFEIGRDRKKETEEAETKNVQSFVSMRDLEEQEIFYHLLHYVTRFM